MPDWAQFVNGCLGRDVKDHCPFCNVSRENGFDLIHADDKFVCFKDRSPGAKVHLLLCPKEHRPNVRYLTSKDVPMLALMRNYGRRFLGVMGVPSHKQRMGFHIAPANSVAHLHLHLLSLPLYPLGSVKYGRRTRWFITIDDAITVLKRGGKVTFGSSKPGPSEPPAMDEQPRRPRVNFRLSRNIIFDRQATESVELRDEPGATR